MSRVGKKPVPIPAGVTVTVQEGEVRVKGPKAELQHVVLTGTSVAVEGGEVRVSAERITLRRRARRAVWNVRTNALMVKTSRYHKNHGASTFTGLRTAARSDSTSP